MASWRAFVLLALLSACDDGVDGVAITDAGGWALSYVLDAGVHPPADAASVLVYVPEGFRPEPPIHAVVWIHGHANCVGNVARDADSLCPGATTPSAAHRLAAQLARSGRNALLIVPEVGVGMLADVGGLARPGGLRAFLVETLERLPPALGRPRVEDLAPLVIAAHSAGFLGLSAILSAGDLPVAEVWHLDSFYGDVPVFAAWVRSSPWDFVGVPPRRRFADIYTREWGTEANSVNMAETAEQSWLPDAGAVLDDRSIAPISDEALRRGLVFKRSPLSHDGVVRAWFERLLSTSRLPPR